MKFLLCLTCRTAWVGPRADYCHGQLPLECSPWSSDGRAWYQAATQHKAAGIWDVLTRDRRENRKALHRGIVKRGNTSVRGRAVA